MKNGINKSHLKTKVCFLFPVIQILFLLDVVTKVVTLNTCSDKVSVNYSLLLCLLNAECNLQ